MDAFQKNDLQSAIKVLSMYNVHILKYISLVIYITEKYVLQFQFLKIVKNGLIQNWLLI